MRQSFAALATAACLAAVPASADPLRGSEWEPIEIDSVTFEPVTESFLRFEQDGRYFGNGGCNTFRGQYVVNEDAILLGPAATTKMACPEDLGKQEMQFLKALASTRSFERDGADLQLFDATGAVKLRLRQRDWD